jgi:SAM-dependent methyltransferase
MVNYYLYAAALKGFSFSSVTKRIYRDLGNTLGGKKRAEGPMPAFYLDRINRMLRIARVYSFPKHGDKLIEIGTGWLHWEAVTMRLFFDVSGILFDVWDNRQINGLKNYMRQLGDSLDRIEVEYPARVRAQKLIMAILDIEQYDDLYKLLGFEYVLNPSGGLASFAGGSFDIAISAGVLEHIYAKDAPSFIDGVAALLKPGGFSCHSINIRDHLYQYDHSASSKQYLHYTDWVWKLCFQNDVQYINRIQRSEWLNLFKSAGLDLLEERVEMEELGGLTVASLYHRYSVSDLGCGGLDLVHRKSA